MDFRRIKTPSIELARLFLKLGLIGFGGPAAHIAMMEEEVVRKRQWLTPRQFLNLVSLTHLIPGPNSTEMAIHIGRERAGFKGLLVAGVCFISPAMLIVTALAWFYTTYGQWPAMHGLLSGIQPVIFAIVLQATWSLSRSMHDRPGLLLVAVGALIARYAGVPELLIVLLAGLIAGLLEKLGPPRSGMNLLLWFFPLTAGAAALATAKSIPFSETKMAWFFLKVGSILYGSGYVLLAFLEGGLVRDYQWLTQEQLLAAISIGQLTPGPVLTTATFIGFLLDGFRGALIATVSIFLPAFFFVALTGRWLKRMQDSPSLRAVLDGFNAASLGLMASVLLTWQQSAGLDPLKIALAVSASLALFYFKINSSLLVVAGAALGILLGA